MQSVGRTTSPEFAKFGTSTPGNGDCRENHADFGHDVRLCWHALNGRIGPYAAVVPTIAGQAWISGLYQMGLDPTDPFPQGFTLSDTWMRALH
jgi:hypothetical protein